MKKEAQNFVNSKNILELKLTYNLGLIILSY